MISITRSLINPLYRHIYLSRRSKYNESPTMAEPSLTTQTLYAELLDRCTTGSFEAEFPLNGSFVRVRVKDRNYWYFQQGTRDASGKQPRKYVGPDTPEVEQLIANHGHAKNDYRERRHLAASLRRAGFQSPPDGVGAVLQALSSAGIFRVRAVVVGTTAYQAYGPMLGIRLPHAALQTGDLDIAQFSAVSVAISKDEQTPPLLDILRQADPSFRAVPHTAAPTVAASYVSEQGFRVEVLTESRGPERDSPPRLPSIGTHAQPLRFLDFLIRDEVPAVILYDAGVLVNVPAPARYALHKLIVAQRRTKGTPKIDKDIQQAASLIDVLAQRRPADLREAWQEAVGRGPKWRELLTRGLRIIDPRIRDQALHVFGATRNILPDLDLTFADMPPRFDFSRETVVFEGIAGGQRMFCSISREALDDHFGADGMTKEERVEVFRRNRREIQELARLVYLNKPVPADGAVLITTADVPALRRWIKQANVKRTTSARKKIKR